ncbi:MAG: DNA-binding protein [Rhizobium sp.]|nr:DNA-binding protein [Rhizobium sp.]
MPAHRHLRLNFLTETLREAIAFDYIAIGGLDIDGFQFSTGRSVDSDMPPLMLESYFGRDFYLGDPVAIHSRQRGKVITEEEAYDLSTPASGLRDLMQRFDIHNRTVFPISRGDTVYGCVVLTRNVRFSNDEMQFLSFVAQPLHTAMTKPLMKRFAAQQHNLSSGEILCLQYASDGLTSEDIAARSGYQIMTVNSYIKSAVKKLNAANRCQAVAEAIRRGLVD